MPFLELSGDVETFGLSQKQKASEQSPVQGRFEPESTSHGQSSHALRRGERFQLPATGGLRREILWQGCRPKPCEAARARGFPAKPGPDPAWVRLRPDDRPVVFEKAQAGGSQRDGSGRIDLAANPEILSLPGQSRLRRPCPRHQENRLAEGVQRRRGPARNRRVGGTLSRYVRARTQAAGRRGHAIGHGAASDVYYLQKCLYPVTWSGACFESARRTGTYRTSGR